MVECSLMHWNIACINIRKNITNFAYQNRFFFPAAAQMLMVNIILSEIGHTKTWQAKTTYSLWHTKRAGEWQQCTTKSCGQWVLCRCEAERDKNYHCPECKTKLKEWLFL